MNPSRLLYVATWLCVTALIVLSLLPGELRPHTGMEGRLEHFIAYAITGLIATWAYRMPVRAVVGLALLSCVMELLQIYVPFRTAAVLDAVASSLGGAVGSGIGLLVSAAFARSELWKRCA